LNLSFSPYCEWSHLFMTGIGRGVARRSRVRVSSSISFGGPRNRRLDVEFVCGPIVRMQRAACTVLQRDRARAKICDGTRKCANAWDHARYAAVRVSRDTFESSAPVRARPRVRGTVPQQRVAWPPSAERVPPTSAWDRSGPALTSRRRRSGWNVYTISGASISNSRYSTGWPLDRIDPKWSAVAATIDQRWGKVMLPPNGDAEE